MSEEFAPIFQPTWEEFKDFKNYVTSIEPFCKDGICKIIPPKEWNESFPEKLNYNNIELRIPTPIMQYVHGEKGVFQLMLMEKSKMSVSAFKDMADKEKIPKSSKYDYNSIERIFWKNVRFNPPMYGADMQGTLFTEDIKHWNLNHLESILQILNTAMPGINMPYLYFGMWKAMFAWHVEDMNLFSINYLHFGAPKFWYCVAPENGPKLERLAQSYFPDEHMKCSEFMRHKTTLISPTVLDKHNIQYKKVIQEAGQFVITFPYAYHMGFNQGFNCAESVNFALESWIHHGIKASACLCDSENARINMAIFLERYDEWKAGILEIVPLEIPSPSAARVPLVSRRMTSKSPQKLAKSPANDFETNESLQNKSINRVKKKLNMDLKKHEESDASTMEASTDITVAQSVKTHRREKPKSLDEYVVSSYDISEEEELELEKRGRKRHYQESKMDIQVDIDSIDPHSHDRHTANQPSTIGSKPLSPSTHSVITQSPIGISYQPMNTSAMMESPIKKQRASPKKISTSEKNLLNNLFTECGGIPDKKTRRDVADKLQWSPSGVYNWFKRKLRKLSPNTIDNDSTPTNSSPPQSTPLPSKLSTNSYANQSLPNPNSTISTSQSSSIPWHRPTSLLHSVQPNDNYSTTTVSGTLSFPSMEAPFKMSPFSSGSDRVWNSSTANSMTPSLVSSLS